MNKTILTLSVAALTAGVLLVTTPSVFAYRGDPNVQGPNYTAERHEVMTKAFDNNDYNAWKEQMVGRGRVTQVINEGNFARFVEMRQLMLDGKTDEANKIRAELGLGQGQKSGYGRSANR